ncbi:MAG: molybdate ABC transporter substrate-binding protein [Verrucomicrobia bacterium]|nr:molybdate ABC transporter substrate-binding protein [Verrucomicrobiota bacterium]
MSTLPRSLAFLCLWLAANLGADAAELRVFAAASLADALGEIGRDYTTSSGDQVLLNLAASSALARQLKEGASADVFFSADEARMDELARAGLLATATRRTLLGNTLVVVVNAERGAPVAAAADLAGGTIRRLALAEPTTVPAGIYAKAWLERAGLWPAVEKKVVGTENVRACLAAVEAGNADAGIVYKTDALISKKVKIAFEVRAAEGPKIAYPVAVLLGARQREAARRFVDYLASPKSAAVFIKHGFLLSGRNP